jgi:hypothetical protein
MNTKAEGIVMLSKGKLWSGCGLAALTIPMTLCGTGIASAAPRAVAAPAPAVYNNQAETGSQTNGWTSYDVEYQLGQSVAATVTGSNDAEASATYCHDCGAIAIGFQVLVVSKQELNTINATNSSEAVSAFCTRCSVFAGAYQIVVATNTPLQLSLGQALGLADIHAKLLTIERDGLSATRSEQLADGLADEAVAVLQGGGHGPNQAAAYSPATARADLPGHLTENTGPIVNLYETLKH